MAEVATPSRIHCLLLDLGRATNRAYGGAGFMIARPAAIVKAERSPQWQIVTNHRLDERTAADLEKIVKLFSERPPLRVSIENMPLQHVGLGSKTSLLLAVIAVISKEL